LGDAGLAPRGLADRFPQKSLRALHGERPLLGDWRHGGPLRGDLGVGGAISLYLDFINLFLAILRILSARRD
jgi:hypothetical protein